DPPAGGVLAPRRQYPAAAIAGTESWRLGPPAARVSSASGCERMVAAQTAAMPPRHVASSWVLGRTSRAGRTRRDRSETGQWGLTSTGPQMAAADHGS